jgi:hypothetical protein
LNGGDDKKFDQGEGAPGLPEIKIREDFFANRFAVFKHRLAHAADKIGTILRLAREPVRVDDGRHFLMNGCRWQELPAKIIHIFTQFTKRQPVRHPFDI